MSLRSAAILEVARHRAHFVATGRAREADLRVWRGVRDDRSGDADGNAVHGRVYLKDAKHNVVHAERGAVVLYGVENLVVVVRDGVTLVTTVERSDDLKALVESLPAPLKELSAP